jgi:hypothetical protein
MKSDPKYRQAAVPLQGKSHQGGHVNPWPRPGLENIVFIIEFS